MLTVKRSTTSRKGPRHARPLGPRHAGRVLEPGPRHVGSTVRPQRAPVTKRMVIQRVELVLLLVIGVPVFLLILPTTVGGRVGWTVVVGQSMEPTIYPGDMVVTRRQSEYAVGEVVVYKIPEGEAGSGVMVIHRITGGSAGEGFVTTGDNREFADPWRPTNGDIVGRHWRTIPKGGYVVAWMRSPLALAAVMASAAFGLTLQMIAVVEARESQPRHARPLAEPAYA